MTMTIEKPEECPEECPYAKHFQVYDWCQLSENICVQNTGNKLFDVECTYYRELLKENYNIF